HVLALRQNLLSVDTLIGVDHDSPFYNEKTKMGIFYAESWAMVHYLMLGNDGKRRPQLGTYMNLVAHGKDAGESFTEAFQTDYATLEKELRQYAGRSTFPAIRYKLQDKIDFDREMQVAPLSEAQAQYYLGDFLLHIDRLDAAETQ